MGIGRGSRVGAFVLALVVGIAANPAVGAVVPAQASSTGIVSEALVVPAANAPACTTGDTLTRYRKTGDWYRTLLDRRYRLKRTYAPHDLVRVSAAGVSGVGRIRRIALADFRAMYRAARRAGARFAVHSAYRSYATQVSTFWSWVRRSSYQAALLTSARGGHSEHQLGTVVDLKTPGGPAPWYAGDWGRTRAGAWLARNSWKYGWVVSYPKARSPRRTCYKYEPWHFRYFGRLIAGRIHRSRLSPREWLWRKGAMGTWTGGPPKATPKPTASPTATPTGSPTPPPTASPTAEPTPDPTPSPTPDPTPSPTPDPTPSPTPSPTPDPTPAP
jgi:zinc D-Ala-D-Ala carboxypeptidase